MDLGRCVEEIVCHCHLRSGPSDVEFGVVPQNLLKYIKTHNIPTRNLTKRSG